MSAQLLHRTTTAHRPRPGDLMDPVGKLMSLVPIAIGLGIAATTPEQDTAVMWAFWCALVGGYSAGCWMLLRTIETRGRLGKQRWLLFALTLSLAIPLGFFGGLSSMWWTKITDVLFVGPVSFALALVGIPLLPWLQAQVRRRLALAAGIAPREARGPDDDEELSRKERDR